MARQTFSKAVTFSKAITKWLERVNLLGRSILKKENPVTTPAHTCNTFTKNTYTVQERASSEHSQRGAGEDDTNHQSAHSTPRAGAPSRRAGGAGAEVERQIVRA